MKTMLRSWALLSCERRLHVRGYELACEKQPLPTTVQFSIVHTQNSSRDSQATGSSNLREFSRKLLANNSPRAFVLFSASSPLVLSILAAKCPRIVFLRKVFLCYQLQQVLSALRGAHLTSNGSFFRLITYSNTLMLKTFLSQRKRSCYDLLARVKQSQRLFKNYCKHIDAIYQKLEKCSKTFFGALV